MISSFNNLPSNKDKFHNVLFYYAGLHNSDKPFAGTNSALVNIASALSESDHYRASLTGDFIYKQEIYKGVDFLLLPAHDRKVQFLEEYDIVIFATHMGYFADIVKPTGQKWILHQHCWAVEPPELARISDFDTIICLSDIHKRAVLTQKVPEEKIKIFQNCIDTSHFYSRQVQRKPHSILFAGAIVPLKGVHILMDAFKLVKQLIHDAELHIYGSASLWRDSDMYENNLKNARIPGVTFHGTVLNDEMPTIYSQNSLLCLPSEIESFGIVSVEAQACGCIPVVHNSGGGAATLLDRQTGFLYSPNTPQNLAVTIISALSQLDSDNSLRSKAIQFVQSLFSMQHKIKDFVNILYDILPSPTGSEKEPVINHTEQSVSAVNTASELDHLIPPEIIDDEFYYTIQKLAREEVIKTVLEIGSSTGAGSTEAFITGLRENPNRPKLFCMEISKPRFHDLQKRYKNNTLVKCYNVSSVSHERFPTEKEVVHFHTTIRTNLNNYPIEQVLGWLRQDIEYVINSGVYGNGIQKIKRENNITHFDMVLIDGSEFTGSAELEEVYGAKFILLDDINAFKNYNNFERLSKDSNYELLTANWNLRNGYAIFKHKEAVDAIQHHKDELPIHFFTIVLNGGPFIRYHIEAFKMLPFRWHWHIIEGVADLKHDTAWSLKSGAKITDELHNKGLSNDGTTEYLDDLVKHYPGNISIYRKRDGSFWDGKLEMVNAPLPDINEECLLWQVDADELWTVEQICSGHAMFMQQHEKTAAYYFCHYFVGENLIITTRDTYGNDTRYEWLRTWRYKPGDRWMSHEPPKLCRLLDGQWTDTGMINPFRHRETEDRGLVFQHYAFVTEAQLKFKERYFGYANALNHWQQLQQNIRFPVLLKNYFPWVKDNARVHTVFSQGIIPIAQRQLTGQWQFRTHEFQPVKNTTDSNPDNEFANWHSNKYDNYKIDPLLKMLPKKILIPRFDTIGDIVLLEGFLEALLNKYPESEIVLAVQETYSQLKPLFPERIKWLTAKVNPYGTPDKNELRTLLDNLANEQWDLVLTTTLNRSYIDDSIALRLNNVRNIAVGEEGEITWWLKNIWRDLEIAETPLKYEFVPVEEFSHETDKYQKLWQGLTGEDVLPAPRLRVSEDLSRYADDILSAFHLGENGFCICNTAGTANIDIKAWPEERFADVFAWIEKTYNLQILVTGHEKEAGMIEKVVTIAKGAHPQIWMGKDGELPLLAAITQKAKLYFGNDTGSMHIAAALGVPVVGIFGGGTFPRFLPVGHHSLGVAGDLPCFQCYWKCIFGDAPCLKLVQVDDAQKAIDIVLQNNALGPNILLSSYKVNDETLQYIEKAARKFKSIKSDLMQKLSTCEADRAVRLEIIERQHKEFAEKLDECEADRAARLDVINKQAEEFARKEKILDEHMKKQYMTIQELQREVENLRRKLIMGHGFR